MLLINQKVDEIPRLRKLILNTELKGLVVSNIIEKSSGMSLTINKLQYAITIDPNDDTFDMGNLVDKTVLLSLCCWLVAFSQKSRLVRLIRTWRREESQKLNVNKQSLRGQTALGLAVRVGGSTAPKGHSEAQKTRVVKALAAAPGIDPNPGDSTRAMALMDTVFNGQLEIVQTLLSIPGIDPNSQSDTNGTALHMAVRQRYTSIVRALLKVPSVDVNLPSHGGSMLTTAIQLNAPDAGLLLLEKPGVNVNVLGDWGATALIHALWFGHERVVDRLLQFDDIHLNVERGIQGGLISITALGCASCHGYLPIVNALLSAKGIDVHHASGRMDTALTQVAANGHLEVVKALFSVNGIYLTKKEYDMPLIVASAREKIDVVKLLLQREDLNMVVKGFNGRMAIRIALESRNEGLIELYKCHGHLEKDSDLAT
ncbi:ankyrin [Coprinopsis marcescibilis]|uniref:Ankyrin n=1 Tax=Coprinopsis marcescibilis TaxID=230819 RepID=A0A5C3KDW1_COPMA|nr:ankyrin [Coprinopsis marcescibilis]